MSTEVLCLQSNWNDSHYRNWKYTTLNSLFDGLKKEVLSVLGKEHRLNWSYVPNTEGGITIPPFHFLVVFNSWLSCSNILKSLNSL